MHAINLMMCSQLNSCSRKSAFANTVIGRDFKETPSTIGIGKFTCDIKYAQVGGGGLE
jgi:hypothetical protein